MRKFIVMVLGLTLFMVLIDYHAPPIVGDANDTKIECQVDFFALENPVEVVAAEVVIKGPGSELIMFCNQIEERNLTTDDLLIRLPALDDEKVMTRTLSIQNLCPRVLSLFPNQVQKV